MPSVVRSSYSVLCLNEKKTLSSQVFYHKVMLLNISSIPTLSSRFFDFNLLC